MKQAIKAVLPRIDRWLFHLLPLPTLPNGSCLVIGHRGAKGWPENTLASFDHALALGADGIELDIIVSRDGVPLVCHDIDISNRVPNHQRPALLNQMTATEAKELNIPGGPIPTLAEALAHLHRRAVRIYAHYKVENDGSDTTAHIKAVASDIKATETLNTVVVMVESGRISPWMSIAPDVAVLQCWASPAPRARRVTIKEALTFGTQHIGLYHSRRTLSRPGAVLHHFGMPHVGSYVGLSTLRRMLREHDDRRFVVFTINDPILMQLYASAGVNAIGSDDPALLRATIFPS